MKSKFGALLSKYASREDKPVAAPPNVNVSRESKELRKLKEIRFEFISNCYWNVHCNIQNTSVKIPHCLAVTVMLSSHIRFILVYCWLLSKICLTKHYGVFGQKKQLLLYLLVKFSFTFTLSFPRGSKVPGFERDWWSRFIWRRLGAVLSWPKWWSNWLLRCDCLFDVTHSLTARP